MLGMMPTLVCKLAGVLREEKPQFVHVQVLKPGMAGILAARLARVPHVLATIHVTASHYGKHKWIPRVLAYRLCNAFVCVSQVAEQSYFGNSCHFSKDLLCRGRRHFTIPNCVNLEMADFVRAGDSNALKTKLGLSENRIVGISGRVTAAKGHHVLLAAMAAVLRRVPSAVLLVVGDGDARSSLQALAVEMGIVDRTVWTGRQSQLDVFRYLAIMDVVAVPSSPGFEGFCLSAAEAMAMGKPVITTGVDGIADVVIANQTSLIVPWGSVTCLAEAVTRLLIDDSLRIQMGQAGRQQVEEHFSFKQFAARHLALYESLATHGNLQRFRSLSDGIRCF